MQADARAVEPAAVADAQKQGGACQRPPVAAQEPQDAAGAALQQC